MTQKGNLTTAESSRSRPNAGACAKLSMGQELLHLGSGKRFQGPPSRLETRISLELLEEGAFASKYGTRTKWLRITAGSLNIFRPPSRLAGMSSLQRELGQAKVLPGPKVSFASIWRWGTEPEGWYVNLPYAVWSA